MKIEYSGGDVDLIAGGALALRAVGFRCRIELVGSWVIIPNGGATPEPETVTFSQPVAAELLDDNRLEILFMGLAAVAVNAVVTSPIAATISIMSQDSKIRQPLLVTQ